MKKETKSKLLRATFELVIVIALCTVLKVLWMMVEVKIYGFYQHSIVDGIAIGIMSWNLVELWVRDVLGLKKWSCDNCKHKVFERSYYCPKCGVKMNIEVK